MAIQSSTPFDDAAVTRVIAKQMVRKIDAETMSAIRPFVERAVIAAKPPTKTSAKNLFRDVSAFVAWCFDVGLAIENDVLFDPDTIERYIHEHRDQVRPGAEIEIGYICGKVWVGEPTWELPPATIAGPPERIAKVLNHIASLGVSHLQLGPAARSAAETCDQLEAFGAEVAPLLTR